MLNVLLLVNESKLCEVMDINKNEIGMKRVIPSTQNTLDKTNVVITRETPEGISLINRILQRHKKKKEADGIIWHSS